MVCFTPYLQIDHPLIINQAPKATPRPAKQDLILTYIQESRTVHNIKELEKSLPPIASINGMQVKDYLQALSDERQIRVEKIGSGNWYWSFPSEEKRNRDNIIEALRVEKENLETSIGNLRVKVEEADAHKGDDSMRLGLVQQNDGLEAQLRSLRKELDQYKDCDPEEVENKRRETKLWKARAERWTDNIGILEGRLKDMMPGDEEQMSALQREIYGDEYIEGQGLQDL